MGPIATTSGALGNHTFLASLRWGLGAQITQPLGAGGSVNSPATVPATVQLTGNPVPGATATTQTSSGPTINILGPGDVTTLDAGQVVRTEPKEGTVNFEPNYFAAIEFADPSLPWIFSPAGVTLGPQGSPAGPTGYPAGGAIPPWVVLVVLAQSEYDDLGQGPVLPTIRVHSPATLPNLLESWAWAHTHVIGGVQPADQSSVSGVIASNPQNVISRIVCPRQLSAETAYTAFLVPAFDIGLQAGLGTLPSPPPTTANPAWTQGQTGAIQLPYFFKFSFATSEAGDFESLVRALQLQTLPGLGFRPLDVSDPATPTWGVGSASSSGTLPMAGAMHTTVPEGQAPWPDSSGQSFQTSLSKLLNQSASPTPVGSGPLSIGNPYASDPSLAPPIYGRWYAGVSSVSPPPAAAGASPNPPLWMQTVNYDPRWRAMAGLGTAVVQAESNQLMAGAWAQFPGVLAANQLLRQAQLARAGLGKVLAKHIASLPGQSQLAVGAPLLPKVLAGGSGNPTFWSTVAQSPVPPAMLGSAVRRAIRLLGPVRVRQLLGLDLTATSVPAYGAVAEVNSGSLPVVAPYAAPGGFVSMEEQTAQLGYGPALDTSALTERFGDETTANLPGVAVLSSSTFAAAAPQPDFTLPAVAVPRVAPPAPAPAAAAAAPAPRLKTGATGTRSAADSSGAAQMRIATVAMAGLLHARSASEATLTGLQFDELPRTFLDALDPEVTVPARVQSRFPSPPILPWNSQDALEPVMAAPSFPNPMYESLLAISEQYLCPGLENFPQNSIAILEPDQQVVEAFMLGLNQEMARLLLWNHYPTDLRGSYFQQFWDPAVQIAGQTAGGATPPSPSSLYDIQPIATWDPTQDLGGHEPTGGADPKLFLVVRGEVLRRYPNTLVYMVAAIAGAGGSPTLPAPPLQPTWPLFQGTLPPDLRYFAFAPSPQQAAGIAQSAAPYGYFFVFQQVHAELRFGLEPDATNPSSPGASVSWEDLSWQNFPNAAFLSPNVAPALLQEDGQLGSPYQPTTAPDSNYSWGTDAASIAYTTLRGPSLVAIPAWRLLGLSPPAPTIGLPSGGTGLGGRLSGGLKRVGGT